VENVNADELLAKVNEEHPYLIMTQGSKVLVLNKTTNKTLFTFTFKEPESGYKFLSDGILLYGYYPDEFVSCEILFLNYNLSLKWKMATKFNISGDYMIVFPQSSEEFEKYILMFGSVVKGFEVNRGLLLFNRFNGKFVEIIPFYGNDLKVIKDKAYILSLNHTLDKSGHTKKIWYEILIYDLRKKNLIKIVKTPAKVKYGEMFYAYLLKGEEYIGLHFSDKAQTPDAVDRICIYTLDLKLIDCLTFEYHEEYNPNEFPSEIYLESVSEVWIIDDYLIIERKSGRKEVYKING
jgi:hypothetical protein